MKKQNKNIMKPQRHGGTERADKNYETIMSINARHKKG